MMKTYVYFIQAGCGDIKIGVSRNPEERLRDLQTANNRRLSLIAKMPHASKLDAMGTERLFHRRFARYRKHGKWFKSVIIKKLRECNRTYELCFLEDMEREAKEHIAAIVKETY